MSTKFIATNSVANISKNDVFSVAVTKEYTITGAGDGYLKLFNNNITELHNPRDFIKETFVDKIGIHQITTFEEGFSQLVIVAVALFNGTVVFYQIMMDGSLKKLEQLSKVLESSKNNHYWAIRFHKDINNPENHRFYTTTMKGEVLVYNFSPGDVENDPCLKLQSTLDIKATRNNGMVNCISTTDDMFAVGTSSGDLLICDSVKCKPLSTIHVVNDNMVRRLEFQPNGKVLAVAYDNGNFGNISLFDTKFGECVGSLTTPTHSSQQSINVNAHDGWIFALDFNTEGNLLLSAGFDGNIRVWDVETKQRVSTLILSLDDFDSSEVEPNKTSETSEDHLAILDCKFLPKFYRLTNFNNYGIVSVGMDKGIRWFREAGGSK